MFYYVSRWVDLKYILRINQFNAKDTNPKNNFFRSEVIGEVNNLNISRIIIFKLLFQALIDCNIIKTIR